MVLNFYGFILSVGILVAWLVARKISHRFGIEKKHVDDILPWIVIYGLAGARLYYVIFSWDYFRSHPADIIAIWKGGISIYGAILGAMLGIYIYTKRRQISFLNFISLAAVAAPLGQAIGRWGNYFNQEAFGRPTKLPWGIYIFPEHRPVNYLDFDRFHPAFLYESIWNLAVFIVLLILLRRFTPSLEPSPQGGGKKEGISSPLAGPACGTGREVRWGSRLAGAYLILYGIGRFFIESIRLDSFYIANFRVDQITSLLIILAGIVILYFSHAPKVLENF